MVVLLLHLSFLEEVLLVRFGSEMRHHAGDRLAGVRHALDREQVLEVSFVLGVVAVAREVRPVWCTYLKISLKL